jgi:DNA-binding NtrC family response regulator
MRTIELVGDGFSVKIQYNEEEGLPLWQMLVDMEKEIVGQTLNFCSGNKTQAAMHLKLNRTTFVEKARKYGFPIQTARRYREEDSALE